MRRVQNATNHTFKDLITFKYFTVHKLYICRFEFYSDLREIFSVNVPMGARLNLRLN